MKFPVGAPQRREIKHWRGFRRGAFGYNESPNKQLPYVLLEGASVDSTCLFFSSRHGASRLHIAARCELPLQRLRRCASPAQAPHRQLSHGPHPQFLDHRPHRPRQEHAGRSDHPALRRPERPRDGSAGARLDGHRARARHHDQGADRGAAVHGARRPHLQPEPDRHARPRRLLLRGEPLAVGLRRRAAGGRRQPGRRGADGGQLLHRARPRRRGGAGAQQDGPAAGRSRARQGRDRGRDRHRRRRTRSPARQDRRGHRRDPRGGRSHRMPAPRGRPDGAAARDDHRLLVRQLRRRRDAGARGRRLAAAAASASA